MDYQRKILPYENWGYPAELPVDLKLLNLSDDQLADLSAAIDAELCDRLGCVGQAFFPRPAPPPEAPDDPQALAIAALTEAGLWEMMTEAGMTPDQVAALFSAAA